MGRILPWRALQVRLSGRNQIKRFASFSYTFPIRQLIAQAKFSDRVGIATLLGRLMGEHPPQALAQPLRPAPETGPPDAVEFVLEQLRADELRVVAPVQELDQSRVGVPAAGGGLTHAAFTRRS